MFESIEDWLISFAHDENNPLGLAMLSLGAGIEYVFPPFPGDTISVAGAVFVTGYGWSFWLVFVSTMFGSLVGSLGAFEFGRLWKYKRDKSDKEARGKIQSIVNKFKARGPSYLILNRFLPGLRPFFFVAAGLAGMTRLQVIGYGGVSALIWTLLLMAVGAIIGANLDELRAIVAGYTVVVGILLAGFVVLLVARAWQQKRKQS